MNKMDEFKIFIAANPSLKTLVDNKEYTWQELYDRFSKNGEEDELFVKHLNKNKDSENNNNESTINNFLDAIKSVDIDKVAEGLNSMKKILNVISEVTSLDEPLRKKNTSFIKDDD